MNFHHLNPYATPLSPFAASVAAEQPFTQHAAFADVDNDGDPDLLLVNSGTSSLWLNEGTSGGFVRVESSAIYESPGEHTFGAFAGPSDVLLGR